MIASLGFMPGSYVGRTRLGDLGYSSGSPSYGLGGISSGEMQVGISAGIDPGILNTLDVMGAQDSDVEELIAGMTDVPTLMQRLSGTQPTQPITAADMQTTSWSSFGVDAALQSLDFDLSDLEGSAATNPAVQSALGSDISAERDQYNAWLAQYQGYVGQTSNPVIINGTIYDRLQASITWPVVVALGIVGVAALYVLGSQINEYHRNSVGATIAQKNAIIAQAGVGTAAINQAGALNQSANADDAQGNSIAATDPARAAQLHQTAAQKHQQATQILTTAAQTAGSGGVMPPQPINWANWFQQNWILVAGVGLLVVLGPSVIKKI